MKKAFTLIEVMVATVLVFLVTFAILNSISNIRGLFRVFDSHKKFELISSISFLQPNKSKNLYEKLIEFNITNDKIIHTLKKYSIDLEKEIDYSNEYNISNMKIKEVIYKLKAYDKYNSSIVYEIGIQ